MPRLVVPALPLQIESLHAHAHIVASDEWWEQVPDGVTRTAQSRDLSASHLGERGWRVTRLTFSEAGRRLDLRSTRRPSRGSRNPVAEDRFARLAPVFATLTDSSTEWFVNVTLRYAKEAVSLVQLPVKVQTGEMTEIRGFRFARTEEPKHQIIIERPQGEGDDLLHHVIFEDRGPLSTARLRKWVSRTQEISNLYVQRGGHDAIRA